MEIAQHAIADAKAKGYGVVIVDTAGRLAVDEQMMQEIKAIKDAIQPNETLFVVDSMTGQDAVNTAKAFNDRLDYDGVVLTKLDGDTRGGAALSIRTVVDKPIKWVGTGEKMEAIDPFRPSGMADRILNMGDIVSLVDRMQQQYDEEQARELQKKIAKNKFDFNDFLSQISKIKKMGHLKDLASMIPGVGKAIKDVDISDDAFKGIEAIIYSMTPYEREHPEAINGSRRQRIARGSGTNIQEVNRLITQFDQTRKAMHKVSNMSPKQLMRAGISCNSNSGIDGNCHGIGSKGADGCGWQPALWHRDQLGGLGSEVPVWHPRPPAWRGVVQLLFPEQRLQDVGLECQCPLRV